VLQLPIIVLLELERAISRMIAALFRKIPVASVHNVISAMTHLKGSVETLCAR